MQNKVRSSSASSGCSGVTDTPAASRNVQGTPDILAELRARADREEMHATELAVYMSKCQFPGSADFYRGSAGAFRMVLDWLDELSACQTNNTAPDTKSGSAGIP